MGSNSSETSINGLFVGVKWRMENLGNNEVGDVEILTMVLIGEQIRKRAATAPCMANLGLARIMHDSKRQTSPKGFDCRFESRYR